MRKIDQDPELFPLTETIDFRDEISTYLPDIQEDTCKNLSSPYEVSSVRRMSDYFPFLAHGREARYDPVLPLPERLTGFPESAPDFSRLIGAD